MMHVWSWSTLLLCSISLSLSLSKHAHSLFHPLLSVAQNQWIRESLFDGHGNYMYCYECILAYIDVGIQRLARQRKIKQELSQHTIVMKSKSEISQLKLEKFVVLPSTDANFQDWWKELGDDEDVEV
jgi:hypothetical protein